MGAKFLNGYGMVRYQKKNFGAHRLSYAMANDGVPDGANVCHTCDNPSCVNPSHLFAGSVQDNVDDMIAKGRKPVFVGERNGAATLTEKQVVEIRELYANGDVTHNELAAEFGVSPATVGLVTSGVIWNHVGGPITNGMAIRDRRPSKIKGEKNPGAKLTEKEVVELRKTYAAGMVTMRQLSDRYGVCPQVVCKIIHREAWKHVA